MEGSDIWIFCIFQGVMFLLWSDPLYENTRSLAATFFYSINWWRWFHIHEICRPLEVSCISYSLRTYNPARILKYLHE